MQGGLAMTDGKYMGKNENTNLRGRITRSGYGFLAILAMPAKAAQIGAINLYPASGPPGTGVTLQGSGFTATTNTTANNFTVYFGTLGTAIASGTVSTSGTISTTFGTDIDKSSYNVYVTAAPVYDSSNYVQFTIMYTPSISLSATSAGTGDQIIVNGSAFGQALWLISPLTIRRYLPRPCRMPMDHSPACQ
jgi:hypothetical protein